MALQTVFQFRLPRGYVSANGQVHQDGQMRLATALDEIESMADPHVRDNEAYLPVVLFSRVITRLGELAPVGVPVIAGLFASDLVYLEELYLRINSAENIVVSAVCPYCSKHFHLQTAPLGVEHAQALPIETGAEP
jgi:hypothetical protein